MDAATARTALLEELKALEHYEEASAESRAPVELDQASQGRLTRMEAIQDHEMALETHRRRELRRLRIEAALKRIDAGDFGECVMCGEPIAPKRLELDPTTPTCIDCAEEQAAG